MYKRILTSALAVFLISATCVSKDNVTLAGNVILPRPAGIEILDGAYIFTGEPTVKVVRKKGPAESYTLEISRKGVKILAADDAGEFYARQSLEQMIRAAKESN